MNVTESYNELLEEIHFFKLDLARSLESLVERGSTQYEQGTAAGYRIVICELNGLLEIFKPAKPNRPPKESV